MKNSLGSVRKYSVMTVTSILIFSMLLSAISASSGDGEWLMYRYDDERTGNSPLTSNIILPKVKWSFMTGGNVQSPPAVGDINHDGEFEVVFGSNDHHLYALDRFGNEIWNFYMLGDIVCSPSIGDVDGDGLNEIVFGGYYLLTGDPYLYVLNGEDGSLVWKFESANFGEKHRGFQASPILYDINDDSIDDILIGSLDYQFYALNGLTGDVIWQSAIFEHFIRASSPLGDIDNDGGLEVVVPGNHAIIRTYDAKTGNLEWENKIGYGIEATPVLADVDGDGYDEIIVFTIGDIPLGISGDVVILNHDGSELWRSSAHTYFYTSPTILDIDGDGLVDIIGGDSNDHTIIAYKGTNGSILWETVLPGCTWSQAPLVTADIDSDGEIEVIAGANPNLFCLNAISGAIEWTFQTTGHIWGQPTIADLEQDGLAEILFGCYDDYLYVLENAYEPPVADAGPDQVIYEGDVVYFNGSGIYDPDGDITSIDWDFGDGLHSNLQNSSHVYGDDGIYTVTLTVIDSQGLTDTDICNITVLNVEPTASLAVNMTMNAEIELKVAGSKWSNVGLTLYEEDEPVGYLEVERWPGNPDDNPGYEDPTLPATIDLSKSYKAIVTYDPYPDDNDEIKGDQPNNGKDKKDNAGNPVWIILRFADGNETKIHHTFNTEQSMIRDSEHPNHIEPWEVNLSSCIIGQPFEITSHVTDPGSDDEILTYSYGSQLIDVTYLNNPPNPDPYPSPEVNPRDIIHVASIFYEGSDTLILTVEDDDGGTGSASVIIG